MPSNRGCLKQGLKMFDLHNRVEKIWWRPSPPPVLLRCIEPVYAAISRIHLKRRAERVKQAELAMISVGNITAGGSGKTPFVLWLAAALKKVGYAPVILCRGDGGSSASPIIVNPDTDAASVGDEAKMLAEMSGCPVIAAADRITACKLAEKLGDIIILDDGFQYRHLGRCCDIVLVPAEGVGNGHQIPAGPLREPVSALSRADIIVRTGSQSDMDQCQPLSTKTEWRWVREPAGLIDAMGSHAQAPHRIFAATSIARPERFFDDLESADFELAGYKSYPDHHRFSADDVSELLNQHASIAVTAKDAVKLAPLWPKKRALWLLPLHGKASPELVKTVIDLIPPCSIRSVPLKKDQ